MTTPIVFTDWRRSSRSGTGGNCVEVAFTGWRKSSRSGSHSNCVEVASTVDAVGIRDSKDPDGPVLAVPHTAWTTFITVVRLRSDRA